ncbi:MAG: alpha/beta hydrolase [Rhizobiales bacterium]|nr:alpha/beta hydrolase [Hyphomicrobiales bacterium]
MTILLIAIVYMASRVSPWPTALMERRAVDRGGMAVARGLEPYVPADISSRLNIRYDDGDKDALLDVFYPPVAEKDGRLLPAVIWVHGGSWVGGSKDFIANYLKILASRGFVAVGVGYSLAPARTYPTPVKQVNVALGFVSTNAGQLHVDPSHLFLAGDSAGSQIAAQVANVISSPAYAEEVGVKPAIRRAQLLGVVLHCGMYETRLANFSRTGVLWSYFGTQDFENDPRLSQFSVVRHITSDFPATFLSAGNNDVLAPQSHLFAEKAAELGVPVDRLFFLPEYRPKVPHEFQFDLSSKAGRLALDRSVKFMDRQLR